MTPTLTVFTPTYNRAYTLGRLYDSLCFQSDKDFNDKFCDALEKYNRDKSKNSYI